MATQESVKKHLGLAPPQNSPAAEPTTASKKSEVVPIIIRCPENWVKIHQDLTYSKIASGDIKKSKLGIQITPTTPSDHRRITTYLNNKKYPYHSYFLPEDRKLNVIIKGLDGQIPLSDIK
ncbi:MAG: hypothetical protein KTM48_02430, partial [Wolbachia endosymbiont of Pissodes strobi]|nr:hypothetical protein [Wolbachia endosymbiont of Pissodes strobi]